MTLLGRKSLLTLAAGCLLSVSLAQAQRGPAVPPFMVESNAFEDGGIVPPKFVSSFAGGENVQPDFSFSNIPESAVSIAVIFHDIEVALNGGTEDVLHWLAWNIPADAGGLPEGSLPEGSVTGSNLMGQNTYFGPGAPATPRYHHYVFEFYALDSNLDLESTAGRDELLAAMQGKVVGKVAYVGRFRGGD